MTDNVPVTQAGMMTPGQLFERAKAIKHVPVTICDRAEMATGLFFQGYAAGRACQIAYVELEDNDGALQMLARHRLAAEQSRASTPAVLLEPSLEAENVQLRTVLEDTATSLGAAYDDSFDKYVPVTERLCRLQRCAQIASADILAAKQLRASTPAVGREAIEAAARAMCDRVNGIGDYDENIEQRRTGWMAQAEAGLKAAILALHPPVMGEVER